MLKGSSAAGGGNKCTHWRVAMVSDIQQTIRWYLMYRALQMREALRSGHVSSLHGGREECQVLQTAINYIQGNLAALQLFSCLFSSQACSNLIGMTLVSTGHDRAGSDRVSVVQVYSCCSAALVCTLATKH
jgi:hypothetical protein